MARYKEITLKANKTQSQSAVTKTQIYRGISTTDPDTKNFALYDIELVKQDLLNHFNIRRGEKIYNPDYGSIIWDVLYEQLTDEVREQLVEDIKKIVNSDPRVRLITLEVVEQEYGIQIGIELEFVAYSQTDTILYNFDRENGLSVS